MSLTRSFIRTLRHGYRRMFQRQEDAPIHEAVEVLRQVPLFQPFSRTALRELAEVMHHRRYKHDEVLYYADDPGLGLYIVQQGNVRLLGEDEEGRVYELRQIGEHEFFGDLPIFGEFRRLETAQAVTETRVLGFFNPDLKILLKRNPSVGAAVAMALARHMATQHMALINHLIEDMGTAAAMRLLRGGEYSEEGRKV